jgi:hypothetical protein
MDDSNRNSGILDDGSGSATNARMCADELRSGDVGCDVLPKRRQKTRTAMNEDMSWVGEKAREELRAIPSSARVLRVLGDAAIQMADAIHCRHPMSGRAAWVYVIHAPEVGRAKIGSTSTDGASLSNRMATLSGASPCRLEIVALAIGDGYLEREWHAKYRAHRHHGEWFAADPIVSDFAVAMRDAPPGGCARCSITKDQWRPTP